MIERNRVSGKAAGIILNDVKNATLRNNIIYECDKHGLQITENSTVTLKGTNKIYSNEKNGISCGSSKLKLQGSTKIYRNGATGLYIYKSKKCGYPKAYHIFKWRGGYHIDRNILGSHKKSIGQRK